MKCIFQLVSFQLASQCFLTCIPARFKSSPVNAIYCQALAGSPLRPQRLTQLDKEQEEQLKPPFSSTSETREVRHGQ